MKEGDEFCASCGASIDSSAEVVNLGEKVYYSKDWSKAKAFAIASVSHFDILITKEHFYLLRMPRTQNAALYLIIGLFILNIIGAVIGAMIGEVSDEKKRSKFRGQWVGLDEQLISKEYEQAIHFRIPLKALKNCITFSQGKFIEINYGSEKIILKKSKETFNRLETFIKELP